MSHCPMCQTLFNGPCGGSQRGKCEINPEVDCAWQLIYDRVKARGQVEVLEEIVPAKSWKSSLSGGPRKVTKGEIYCYEAWEQLEKDTGKGRICLTGELGPPKGNDVAVIKRKAEHLRGKVDAVKRHR